MELQAQIAELQRHIEKLPPGSFSFAHNLINQYLRKHSLSEDQVARLEQLIAEAKGEAA